MGLKFEVLSELTLKVTTTGNSKLFAKAGSYVAGECNGEINYKFDKVLLGPEGNSLQALGRQILRRVTGENLPLMSVESSGNNVLYFANLAQHVVVYKLDMGEVISVESENILAFTPDCKYGVRFIGQGLISQKGLATSTLTGQGPEAYVAILVDGNPLVFSNANDGKTITSDPDAVVCWMGNGNTDPEIKTQVSWKNLIGQSSGESYFFKWGPQKHVTVIVQPNERQSGIGLGMDGGSSGSSPTRQTFRIGM